MSNRMPDHMPEGRAAPSDQLCHEAEEHGATERTFYVHLNTGEIAEIDKVSGLEVTDDVITFLRGGDAPLSYRRDAVFFACCDRDRPPSQL
jgi:hypothetical protein